MVKQNSQNWEITKIVSSSWHKNGNVAFVWASNWANDEIYFEMSIHPDGYSVTYNFEFSFYSAALEPYMGADIVEKEILPIAEEMLEDWWDRIIQVSALVRPKQWKTQRGLPADESLYAAVALLYSERKRMNPLKVTSLLADDMGVPLSTAKERVRKARQKGFLTTPGKGLNGQGEITEKAIKTLKKARLSNEKIV
jgi:hypothetical protein